MDHIDYRHMSPVIIPRGYTKKYIEGKLSYDAQIKDIEESFDEVAGASDVVLIEGTGHCVSACALDALFLVVNCEQMFYLYFRLWVVL